MTSGGFGLPRSANGPAVSRGHGGGRFWPSRRRGGAAIRRSTLCGSCVRGRIDCVLDVVWYFLHRRETVDGFKARTVDSYLTSGARRERTVDGEPPCACGPGFMRLQRHSAPGVPSSCTAVGSRQVAGAAQNPQIMPHIVSPGGGEGTHHASRHPPPSGGSTLTGRRDTSCRKGAPPPYCTTRTDQPRTPALTCTY